MEERKNHHRSNRKWLERCLAYLMAFAITITSVPMNTVYADTDNIPPTSTEASTETTESTDTGIVEDTETTESTDTDIALDTETSTEDSYLVGAINETEGGSDFVGWTINYLNFNFNPTTSQPYCNATVSPFWDFNSISIEFRKAGILVARVGGSSTLPTPPGEIVDWYYQDISDPNNPIRISKPDDVEGNYRQYFPMDDMLLPGNYQLVVDFVHDGANYHFVGGVEVHPAAAKYTSGMDTEFKNGYYDEDNNVYVVYYRAKPVAPVIESMGSVSIEGSRPYDIKSSFLVEGNPNGLGSAFSKYLTISGTFNATEITPEGQYHKIEVNVVDDYKPYYREDLRENLATFKWRVEYADPIPEDDRPSVNYATVMKDYMIEKPDAEGVYWFGVDDRVELVLGPQEWSQEIYNKYEIEISIDGENWDSRKTAFTATDKGTINYYIRSIKHNYYATSSIQINIDNVVPTGSFVFRGVEFDAAYLDENEAYTNQFFWDGTKEETITYTVPQKAAGAQITDIAWALLRDGLEPSEDIRWNAVSNITPNEDSNIEGSFKITPNSTLTNNVYAEYGSNVIWMKIQDKSNNITYISSDNIIIYKNLTSGYDDGESDCNFDETDSYVSYTKAIGGNLRLPFTSMEGAFVVPERNVTTGNMPKMDYINSVAIRSVTKDENGNVEKGEYRVLSAGEYTIGYDDGQGDETSDATKDKAYIELDQSCFGSSAISTEYDVKVVLKPFEKTFVSYYGQNSAYEANNEPTPVYFHIKMEKAESKIEIAEVNGSKEYTKIYDGTPYSNFSFITTEGGRVDQYHAKLKYENGVAVTDPTKYTTEDWLEDSKRCDVGDYFVYAVLTFDQGSVYESSSTSAIYTITKRPVSANIVVAEKTYDNTTVGQLSAITVNTTIEGKNLYLNPAAFSAVFPDANVADNMTATINTDANGEPVINTDTNGNNLPLIDPAKVSESDKYENYKITFASAQSSIKPAPVTITLNSAVTSMYGDTTNTPQVKLQAAVSSGMTITGAIGSDAEAIKGTLEFSTDATYKTAVGNNYTITAKSTNATYSRNYSFTVATKVKITQRPVEATWSYSAEAPFKYNEMAQTVTATVAKALNTDKIKLTYATEKMDTDGTYKSFANTNKATEVGKYRTYFTVDNTNYYVPADCYLYWEITSYTTKEKPTVKETAGEAYAANSDVYGWYKDEVLTIQAPSGYMIAGEDKQWSAYFEVYDLEDGINNVTYYLKNYVSTTDPDFMCVTDEQTMQIAVDTTAPTGTVTLKDSTNSEFNAINSLLNYLFGKTKVDFKVTFEDEDPVTNDNLTHEISKVQYGIIRETAAYDTIKWETYDKSSGSNYTKLLDTVMGKDEIPWVVYVRITDKAGNVTEMNSAGIVVYRDSVLNTSSLSYTKYQTESVTANITFNDNTVNEVSIWDANKTQKISTLTENVHYEIGTSFITFKPAAFDALPTNAMGTTDYHIIVTLNPLAKEYNQGAGTEPTPLAIPLTLWKATTSITVENYHKVYDGKPVKDLTYNTISTGTVTATYYQASENKASDGTISYSNSGVKFGDGTVAPKDAGHYFVVLTVAESENYQELRSNSAEIYIEKKLVNAYIDIASKIYDSSETATVSDVRIQTGIDGEKFKYESGLVANFVYDSAGTDKEVYIGGSVSTDDDETYYKDIKWNRTETSANPDNYVLEYHIGRANINKRPLGIYVEQIAVKYTTDIAISNDEFTIHARDIQGVTGAQNLIGGDELEDVLSISYNPEESAIKNVNLSSTTPYEIIPYPVPLEEFSIYCTNYQLTVVNDDGSPSADGTTIDLLIYPKELFVDWKAENGGLSKDVTLKENTKIWPDGKNKPHKIVQNDTVIYNGKEYTVLMNGVSGIINNDTVKFDEDISDTYKDNYKKTLPGTYNIAAYQMNDDALDPDENFVQNKNWNYIIPDNSNPDDRYDDKSYNRTFTWNIKYLDEYYYEDEYSDNMDSLGDIYANSKSLPSISTVNVTGETADSWNQINNSVWITGTNVDGDENKVQVDIKPYLYYSGYQIVEVDENENAGADDDWQDSLTMQLSEGKHELTYALKDSNGYITSVRKAPINVDRTAPTATIKLEEVVDSNPLTALLTKVGFFDQKATLTILSEDVVPDGLDTTKVSGIDRNKLYYKIVLPTEDAATIAWKVYSNPIEIKKDTKAEIYVRVTDNAGNYADIDSKGIVVYDNTMSTGVGSFTEDDPCLVIRTEAKDIAATIKTNGYPIASVKYGLATDTANVENWPTLPVATSTTNPGYTIVQASTAAETGTEASTGDTTFTMNKAFIDSLLVEEGEEETLYKVIIKYAPLGEEWDDSYKEGFGTDGNGTKPNETELYINVRKADGQVVINPDYANANTYNGKEVQNPDYTYKSTSGTVTIQYATKLADGSYTEYSTTKPVDAGEYKVYVCLLGDENYLTDFDELAFTIAPKPVEIELPVNEKVYDGTKIATLDFSNSENAFATGITRTVGEDTIVEKIIISNFNQIQCEFESADAATEKTVTILNEEAINIVGEEGTTNAANYEVSFKASSAKITPRPVTVTVEAKEVQYGEEIPTTYESTKELATEGSTTGLVGTDDLGTIKFKTDAAKGNVPRDINYNVLLDEEKSEINPNYTVNVEGTGKCVIVPRELTIEWPENNAFIYTTETHKYEPTIADDSIVGTDGVTLVYEGHSNSDANEDGTTYTTTVTGISGLAKDYYELPENVTHTWTISYDTAVNSAVASLYVGENALAADKWTNQDVTIKAPSTYLISTSENGPWTETISYKTEATTNSGADVKYYLKKNDQTGAVSEEKYINVKLDKSDAQVTIKKDTNILNAILTKLTFGLFFKEEVELDVEVVETVSGIKSIEYLLAAEYKDYENVANAVWTDITEDSSIVMSVEDAKAAVFVKVTDNAGNVIVVNSDGIVVWTDTEFDEETVEYTKFSCTDAEKGLVINLGLNGNTVNTLTIGTTTLIKDTHYEVVEDSREAQGYGNLTIFKEYLDELDPTEYAVKITYNPQGITNATGVTLIPTEFDLSISRNANGGTVSIKDDFEDEIIYNDENVDFADAIETNMSSRPTIEYKLHSSDDDYSTRKPKNVGVYDVRITFPEDDNYGAFDEEFEEAFEIIARPITVVVEQKTVTYGQTIPAISAAVKNASDLVPGDDYSDLKVTLTLPTAKDAGTYTATAVAANANYAVTFEGLASALVINQLPITVDWGTTEFVYTAKTHTIAPTITNLVPGDTCEITFTETSVTSEDEVSENGYFAEISALGNGNYTTTGATGLTCNWFIRYATAPDAIISPELTGTWYKTDVTITAPTDYVISTQNTNPFTGWDTKLTVSTEGTTTVTYFLQYVGNGEGTGAITDAKTVTVNIDKTAPINCEINIEGNKFKELLNDITFGLFFKKTVNVTISGEDEVSDIATWEFQRVESEADYADVPEKWESGNSFSISPNDKRIVYAKITDNAGHFTIINSKGVVVYTDVAQGIFETTYTKTTKDDVTVDVTSVLNANTIKAVSYNGETLPAGAYGVNGGIITLDGEYLDANFAAGTHTLKVSYNPFGVATTEAVDISLTDIVLNVKKQTLTDVPTITLESNTVYYDGEPAEISATHNSASTGAVKLSYKPVDALDDVPYAEGTPINVGSYIVKAVVEADDNYEAIEATTEFTIKPRPVTVDAGIVKVMSNNGIVVDVNKVTVADIVEGHKVQSITAAGTTTTVTENGTYTITNVVLVDEYDNDVTANYAITCNDGRLVVEHNTGLAPSDITVEVPSYEAGDTFDAGDLDVVAIYEDGYTKELGEDDIVVDTTGLDMNKVGTYPITVSYTENEVTKTKQVAIVVTHSETSEPEELAVTVPSYVAGDEFDVEDLIVVLTYEDGYTKELSAEEFTVDTTGLDMSKVGSYPITVSYTENDVTVTKTATVVVTHNEDSIPVDLVVVVPPYEAGDEFEAEDLNVVVVYEDGHTEELDAEDIIVDTTGLDMDSADEQTIKVSYTENDVTVTKDVVIGVAHNEDSIPVDLAIVVPPYVSGDEFDVEDLTVVVTYEDGYTEVLDAEDITVDTSNLDMSKAGDQTITVSYTANGETVTKQAPVTVAHNVESKPEELTVVVPELVAGDTFDVEDITVVVTYEDGHTEELDAEDITVDTSTLDMSKAGDQTIKVSYTANGETVTKDVTVTVAHNVESKPADITVVVPELVAGDAFDVEDITVKVTYEDGYTEEIEATDIVVDTSALDMSKVGEQTITVSYTANGETVTKQVPVTITHNEESKPADITVVVPEFVSGDTFGVEDFIVKVTYEDGYTEEIEATDIVVDTSSLDMSKAGEQTITVSYTVNGETVTKDVTVVIAHNTTLAPTDLNVELPAGGYKASDVLNLDEIKVTVTYADGYTKVLSKDEYETNIASIDMSQIGTKELTVSYVENNTTLTKTVSFEVAHNPAVDSTVEVILPSYEYELSEDTTAEEIKAEIEAGIMVKISYADGYVLSVTDYTTNIAAIDWATPGVKTIVVSYTENGVSKTAEVLVVIKELTDEGTGEVEVIPGEGAPKTNIENTNTEELRDKLLTEEEKVAVDAGEDYKIYLEVKDIADEVSDEHKTKVADAMVKGQKLGSYIDISLYTKVGNNEATKISNSNVPIEITIEMPKHLRSSLGHIIRKYQIVRVHELGEGQEPEVTVIDLNRKAGEKHLYTFVTDRFSTYAIVYTETDTSKNDQNFSTDTGLTGTGVPKTGDEAMPFVWSFALIAAMGALTVCVKRLTKKRG